jgi:hypothetical protein
MFISDFKNMYNTLIKNIEYVQYINQEYRNLREVNTRENDRTRIIAWWDKKNKKTKTSIKGHT